MIPERLPVREWIETLASGPLAAADLSERTSPPVEGGEEGDALAVASLEHEPLVGPTGPVGVRPGFRVDQSQDRRCRSRYGLFISCADNDERCCLARME